MDKKAKSIAYFGVMISLALVASYLETLFPIFIAVPGIKIGLANVVTLILLYKKGIREAAIVSLVRIILSSVLFSGLFSMIYSLAGAVFSILFMVLLKRTNRFQEVGVSVMGAVMHNVGQIIMACIIMEEKTIFYYLPVLIVSGTMFGIIIGMITGVILKKLPDSVE